MGGVDIAARTTSSARESVVSHIVPGGFRAARCSPPETVIRRADDGDWSSIAGRLHRSYAKVPTYNRRG